LSEWLTDLLKIFIHNMCILVYSIMYSLTKTLPVAESRRSVKKSATRCHLRYFSRRTKAAITTTLVWVKTKVMEVFKQQVQMYYRSATVKAPADDLYWLTFLHEIKSHGCQLESVTLSQSTALSRLWAVGLGLAWARDEASAAERDRDASGQRTRLLLFMFCCTLCK